jgi:hypothetical protein
MSWKPSSPHCQTQSANDPEHSEQDTTNRSNFHGRQIDFTTDEWKLLLEGMMMAGIAVTAADPRGCGACLRGFASSSELGSGGKLAHQRRPRALTARDAAEGKTQKHQASRDSSQMH